MMAPATLMLIAHVEQTGVWRLEGGMHSLAHALADLASERGATIHYGRRVERLLVERGRVSGGVAADGERFEADAVVFNGDAAALGAGALGEAATRRRGRRAPAPFAFRADLGDRRPARVSPFRITMCSSATTTARNSTTFSNAGACRASPTIYICAQRSRRRGRARAGRRAAVLSGQRAAASAGAGNLSSPGDRMHANTRRFSASNASG